MSYCVNCGVELESSSKKCPLCNVEVINPALPIKPDLPAPYPRRMEMISKRFDRNYFASLAGVIILIPLLVTIMTDLMTARRITWSVYVIGALFVAFIWFVFPFYFKNYYPAVFMAVNGLAVAAYVAMIAFLSGKRWYFELGLPICLSASFFTVTLTALFTRKKKLPALKLSAAILFSLGLFVVSINIIIAGYAQNHYLPSWSLFALVPCLLLGLAAMIIDSRRDFKERIRKRLFF